MYLISAWCALALPFGCVVQDQSASDSNQHGASGCQGELLEVFVVLDVGIDCLPDDLGSFRSKLFEPLVVFLFIALRFLLLSATRVSSIQGKLGRWKEEYFQTLGKLS